MSKKIVVIVLLFMVALNAQDVFYTFFKDSTLRVDYYHTGNANTETITLDRFYQFPFWSGTTQKLIDPFDNGKYYVKLFDAESGQLLFSRGYNSYFGEYQTTSEAKQGTQRTYHETLLLPFPKVPVILRLYVRDRLNRLQLLFELPIDSKKVQINNENRALGVRVFRSHYSGPAHQNVDIVFLAEGYTVNDSAKFKQDLQRFTKILLQKEPFKTYQNKLNIYGVFKPSAEAHCDEPTHQIFKNTVLNCSFNALGSYRYLLTEDNRTMHDLASATPHDAIIVMVNHSRYGGGGIYNFFMDFTTDNFYSANVFIHEFGHSFAGLADEYYASSTAYDEFYPADVEPTEPNITRLLQPDQLKWKNLVEPGTPIPTPWQKERFDQLQIEYQQKRQALNKQLAELTRKGADSLTIAQKKAEATELAQKFNQKMDEILHQDQFSGKVGAFEGAGYQSKGMYRPMLDCVMFRNGDKPFCRVCTQRIAQMIEFLSE